MSTIQHDRMLEVLAEGRSTPHRIIYVVAQGKEQGARREIIVYYGAPNPKDRIGAGTGQASARKTFLQGGLLPFSEFGSGRLLTLFTYNIIKFDGKQVIA